MKKEYQKKSYHWGGNIGYNLAKNIEETLETVRAKDCWKK